MTSLLYLRIETVVDIGIEKSFGTSATVLHRAAGSGTTAKRSVMERLMGRGQGLS